ncbi:MAG: AAA family ATPase, partial [Erysipelotrichaceae bacterium]|nr:AAA family ATPase [Erysipelotrichaceae bacterium]
MKNDNYLSRIVDKQLELKLRAFGATHIVGPKWCGKTTTAEQYAKSAIKLQRDPNKEALIKTAEINPIALLHGEKPRLIDEWQDAPNLWDAVRSYCDENKGRGHFILTGSTSKKVSTSHTGTGRISKLKMYPMSLYESKESNGTVSIMDLFDGKETLEEGCSSNLSIEQLIFAACRGGWPESILFDDRQAQLAIPKDYY